jgi:predicted AAA+ superfamily ATPase
MERINRNEYIALVHSLQGKGEAVVLTGHRRAGKSCILELLAADLAYDIHRYGRSRKR